MKNSIAYFSKDKQEDVDFLINEVLKPLPQTEYIVLYGCYARDNYVRRGIRFEEARTPTVTISDYDILVFTSSINNKKVKTVLDNVEDIFFVGKDFGRDTPEEKRLFNFIKATCADVRYNPIPKVDLLRDITERICGDRIKSYGEN